MKPATTQTTHRARWAAIGAAIAVSIGAGGIGIANATSPDGASAFDPITPCRLADTRPAPDNVGTRSNPIAEEETQTFNGWASAGGTGDCTGADLPDGITGLELNVTAVNATENTNLRLWPQGDSMPTASNLNPLVGQEATPNSVSVALGVSGQFNVYNRFGTVDIVIDVVGYYTDHDHDDRYPTKDAVYTKAEVDALLTARGPGAEWINVASDGSVVASSPGLAGTTIERPEVAPVGHYCLVVPESHGLTSDAAVASVQNPAAGASTRTAVVTTTYDSACDANGDWLVAVETFTESIKVDNSFTLLIPIN